MNSVIKYGYCISKGDLVPKLASTKYDFRQQFRDIAPSTASLSTTSRCWEYFFMNGETQADKRKRERENGRTPRRYRRKEAIRLILSLVLFQ